MGEIRRTGAIVTTVEGEGEAQAAGDTALKSLQGAGRSLQDVTATLQAFVGRVEGIADGLGAL